MTTESDSVSEDDDADEPTTSETRETGSENAGSQRMAGAAPRRQVTFSLRWDVLVTVILLVAAAGGIGLLSWQLRDAESGLAAMHAAADTRQHAEQVALDYAQGASQMDYKDLPAWTARLVANTTPELTAKLKEAAVSMEQIIVPMRWDSTSTPITAKVRSEHDGVFVVNCFVSVMTKNVQTPDGIQSTATYTVTVNRGDNWIITDVGGVDSALKAGQ